MSTWNEKNIYVYKFYIYLKRKEPMALWLLNSLGCNFSGLRGSGVKVQGGSNTGIACLMALTRKQATCHGPEPGRNLLVVCNCPFTVKLHFRLFFFLNIDYIRQLYTNSSLITIFLRLHIMKYKITIYVT